MASVQLQQKKVFRGENTGFSLSHALAGCSSQNRYPVCIFFVLAFLGLSLFSFVACGKNCSSSSINSGCTASTQPEVVTPRPSNMATVTPYAGRNGKQEHKPSRPATAGQTPRSIVLISDEQLVKSDVQSYAGLVLDGSISAEHKAYNKLDVSLRNQVTFDDFVNDSNYTLYKGCWKAFLNQIVIVQVESSIWVAALPMTNVTCVDFTTSGQYTWYFRIHFVYSLPEIVAVALQQAS